MDVTAKEFGILWSPELQEIYGGAAGTFHHDGPINTYPSHDMAHAIIAANGRLNWLPSAMGDETRVAEYNAVLMENLLDKTCHYVKHNTPVVNIILRSSLKYLRWFVYKHFDPFPMPAEEAYRRFCQKVDPEVVVRLSPFFFDLRTAQDDDPEFMQRTWHIRFDRMDTPPASELAEKCRGVLADVMRTMTSAD